MSRFTYHIVAYVAFASLLVELSGFCPLPSMLALTRSLVTWFTFLGASLLGLFIVVAPYTLMSLESASRTVMRMVSLPACLVCSFLVAMLRHPEYNLFDAESWSRFLKEDVEHNIKSLLKFAFLTVPVLYIVNSQRSRRKYKEWSSKMSSQALFSETSKQCDDPIESISTTSLRGKVLNTRFPLTRTCGLSALS